MAYKQDLVAQWKEIHAYHRFIEQIRAGAADGLLYFQHGDQKVYNIRALIRMVRKGELVHPLHWAAGSVPTTDWLTVTRSSLRLPLACGAAIWNASDGVLNNKGSKDVRTDMLRALGKEEMVHGNHHHPLR